MTTLRNAALMALTSLENAIQDWTDEMEYRSCVSVADEWAASAKALRSALEQQAKHDETYDSLERYTQEIRTILADATKRKPLSEGKIGRLCGKFDASHSVAIGIARAIEQAHGIGEKE